VALLSWIDFSMSLRILMFGRLANLGIYILMMKQALINATNNI
jgi:hypothetical protein